MFRSTLAIATASVVALSALSAPAFARNGARMVIFKQDGDKVTKVFDDGRLDGRGCIIGKVAKFDPKTGGLKVVPKVKCNF